MFTIIGRRPGANYARVTPMLDNALGCLQEAEQQGFLGVKVWNGSGRTLTLSEIHQTLSAVQSPERKETTTNKA
jgi:hypothetical protein